MIDLRRPQVVVKVGEREFKKKKKNEASFHEIPLVRKLQTAGNKNVAPTGCLERSTLAYHTRIIRHNETTKVGKIHSFFNK